MSFLKHYPKWAICGAIFSLFLLPVAALAAPTVSITGPADGSTVSGTIPVSATASGAVGVQFRLDGVNLGAEDTASPYFYLWNTTTGADGSHTITAVARDAGGGQTTATAVVTVTNSTDTTPPSAPSGLTATVSSSSQITLNWTASSDATGVSYYIVERCQGVSCSSFSEVGTPAVNNFNSNGLSPSTSYSFRVRATDAAENFSAYSNTVSAVTAAPPDTTPPSVPTGLTASVNSYSQITLSWNASTDAVGVTGYELWRCQGIACSTFENFNMSAVTNNVDPGLTAATPYSYRVRATDAAGNFSAYSSTVSAVTAPAPKFMTKNQVVVINGPVNVRASANTSGTLLGTQATGALGDILDGPIAQSGLTWYQVNFDTIPDGWVVEDFLQLASAPPPSDTTLPTVTLTLPTNGSTVSGSVPVAATASDNVGVVGVQFMLDGASLGAEDTTSPYSYIWNTTTATNGAHTLTAIARDAAGNQGTASTVSVTVTNTTSDTTAPTAPTNLVATAVSASGITLTWTASTDAVGVTGYRVERCQGTSCSSFAEIGTLTGTSYVDTGLTASTAYSYRVRATDAAGNLSGYSSAVSATTQAASGDTNIAPSGVAYRWSKNSSATSNANKVAAPGLNDNNLTTDVHLNGGTSETALRYEAGGVIWSGNQTVSSVSFVQGTWETSDDGGFGANLALQFTTDGTTWANSGWSVSPQYVYNSNTVTGQTYTFTGTPTSVRGVRVAGQVRTATTVSSYWENMREVMAYSSGGTPPPPGDTTAPTTPTGLSATVNSTSQITLNWTASTDAVGVTGYRVERCQGTSCSSFAEIGTLTGTSYVDTGLTASTPYSYRVRATDAAGNLSGYSSAVSAATQAIADTTAPVISAISAGNITTTGATITWTTNENADTQVEYGLTTAYGQSTTLNTTLLTAHSQAVTALNPGTLYHYRVKSKDAAGNLGQSLDQTFTTTAAPDTQAPNAVSGMSASGITQTSATLTWIAPSDLPGGGGVAFYDIRYMVGTISVANWGSATQATGEPAPATPGTTQTYALAGLTGGVTYTVAIRSIDAAGNLSALSNIVSVTTTTPPPPVDTTAPVISAISAGNITTTGATITWTTNENADTQVEYGLTTAYGQSTTLNTTLLTAHSQAVTALNPGTLYHYRVKSKDAAGNLGQSSDNTFATLIPPDTTPPTTPSALTGTANSPTQITLTWSASTDAVGVIAYHLYRCTGASCTATTDVGTTTSISFTDVGLTANTVYRYRVKAGDAAGNLSAYSSTVSVTTPTTPVIDTTPPTLSVIVATGTAATLMVSWTTNEPADSRLLYGTSGSTLSSILSDSALTSSHALTANGLRRRTAYSYQVASRDAAGNTSTSTTGSFTTGKGRPSPITNLQVANGSVVLSWTRPDDPFLSSVQIFRSTTGYPTASTSGALQATVTDLSATSFHDNNISYGTTYYYTLYAVDDEGLFSDGVQVSFTPTAPAPVTPPSSGGGGGGGGGSSVPTVTPPTTPLALGAPDQIVLTWTNPTGSSFVRTRVVRKAGSPPVDINDGIVIYEGTGNQFTDKQNLASSTVYYYAIVALDQSLRPSAIVRAQAKLGEKTEAEVVGLLSKINASTGTNVTPTPIPTGGAGNGTIITVILLKDLKMGMTDPDILKLQDFLKKLGYLPATHTPTSYFGPLTLSAVIKYQQSKKIDPPAGFVGPLTRRTMGAGSPSTPATSSTGSLQGGSGQSGGGQGTSAITRALWYGMEGNDVLLLQVKLKSGGYLPSTITPNGIFGPATKAAVQKLQCLKLKICSGTPESTGYGLVGRMTRAALGL